MASLSLDQQKRSSVREPFEPAELWGRTLERSFWSTIRQCVSVLNCLQQSLVHLILLTERQQSPSTVDRINLLISDSLKEETPGVYG